MRARWGFVAFAVRACGAIPAGIIRHAGEVVAQFEQVAVRSLPIVLGAGLSVGLVTWLQTHRLLVQHGAESTLPSFLAVAVLVEIGPVLAGLLVASRMGAGLAAELGSMVFNEEIDARDGAGRRPGAEPGRPAGDRLRAGRPVIDGDHRRLGAARRPGRRAGRRQA